MNKSKGLIALSCILAGVLVFSFKAITTATPNTGTISVTTTNDEFGTGTDCSLREAIQSANADSDFGGCTRSGSSPYTIQLLAQTYTLTGAGGEDNNASGDLDIKASLIIQGVSAVSTIIQAGPSTDAGVDRVIHIPTSSFSVTLSDLTIRYGRLSASGEGGGINRSGDGTLNIINCIITLNRSETGFGGGGIANYNGTVNLQNSTVSGNSATGSSGKNAGGIYNDKGTFNITENSVIGGAQANLAYYGAGIFNVQGGTVVIDSSTVSGNTASVNGGGILNSGSGSTVTIQNGSLIGGASGNTANYGGGIFNVQGATLTINASTISGNTANNEGGGILNSDSGSSLNVLSGSLIGGTYPNTAPDGGGIINRWGATANISASMVSGNTGTTNGGGLLNTGQASTMTIEQGSQIYGNSTTYWGGGLYNGDGSVTIDASDIYSNTAGDGGGALHNGGATGQVAIQNGSLIGGANPNSARVGGGIYADANGLVTVKDSAVMSNTATQDGGGFRIGKARLMLENAILQGNTADSSGGGIFCDNGSTVTITQGSQIYGNTAVNWGGGIYNGDSTVTVDDSDFYGNTAGDGGGAIHNGGGMGQFTIQNSSVIGGDLPNTAEIGGGIYADAGSLITVQNGSIISNTADYGGGALITGAILEITNGNVSGNTATVEGGGIYNDDGGSVTIDRSTISANSSDGDGGGVYSAWEALTILVNSTVSGNSAQGDGGGIYTNYTTTMTLTHVTITSNWADSDKNSSGDGGGIYRDDTGDPNTTVNFANTLIAGNHRSNDDSSPDCFGTLASLGHNLIGNNAGCSGLTDGINGDQVGTPGSPLDPLLGSLVDNGGPTWTHALDDGSPAIDAADNTICQATPANGIDQRSLERINTVSTTCDIGAYERLFAISIFIPLVLK